MYNASACGCESFSYITRIGTVHPDLGLQVRTFCLALKPANVTFFAWLGL
jgi:hypothetical protein